MDDQCWEFVARIWNVALGGACLGLLLGFFLRGRSYLARRDAILKVNEPRQLSNTAGTASQNSATFYNALYYLQGMLKDAVTGALIGFGLAVVIGWRTHC